MTFERSKNPIKNWWRFLKNSMSLWKSFKSKGLVFLFLLLFSFLVFFVIFLNGINGLFGLLIFIALAVLFELFMFILATKKGECYKTKSITLQEDALEVLDYKETSYKIPYSAITSTTYSSQLKKMLFGIAGSSALFSVSSYLIHFVIKYTDEQGNNQHIPVPLDLKNVSQFLKLVIEKSDLQKQQSKKDAMFYEWVKSGENKEEDAKNESLRPGTLNPNMKVSKLVTTKAGRKFLLIIILVIIARFLIKYFTDY